MKKIQRVLCQSDLLSRLFCCPAMMRVGNAGHLQRFDTAWFVVAILALLALGATLFIGMTIWCLTNGHGAFTGAWSYWDLFSVNIECSW